MIKAPKGTKDILPKEVKKWQFIEAKAKETAKKFNVSEIRTPMFEYTELFKRGVGDDTDIVNKEMYTFNDKAKRSITLKPEGTASVVRSFIENGFSSEPKPLKLYYISPLFRYEKPQKGRFRQHNQFGVEYFGSDIEKADAEIITLADDFLKNIGLENYKFKINTLGDEKDREHFSKELKKYFSNYYDQLCDNCKKRLKTNPLRILDCKIDNKKDFFDKAPVINDFISDKSSMYFNSILKNLDYNNVNYEVDPSLVRGLDYYTETVFEIVETNSNDYSSVLGGGGRYNRLVESLGGNSTPAIGFGIGIERVLLSLDNKINKYSQNSNCDIYILPFSEKSNKVVQNLASNLRKLNLSVEIDLMNRSMKSQLKYANKLNVKYVLFVGEEEVKNKNVKVKNMSKGKEEIVNLQQVPEYISKELKNENQ
ncbi:MAG: histidine--tRNA ligase [Candidatus Woesearchaeota archaeon]